MADKPPHVPYDVSLKIANILAVRAEAERISGKMEQSVGIGDYTLARDFGGGLWLSHTNGESMQLNAQTETRLIRRLAAFWKKNF